MRKPTGKLLVVQAAALSRSLLAHHERLIWQELQFHPLQTVFPAVTCPVQASFRTGLPPTGHGVVGNGFMCRDLRRPLFWEQSASLVTGPRWWEPLRQRGRSVGMLFWQQSLGESVDLLLSPAPVHKHHGGMISSCYSQPANLYKSLRDAVGRDFSLLHYWGPMASRQSSDWIARATAALLADAGHAPDLCLTYLPVLDYDLQRFGPESPQAAQALAGLLQELDWLLTAAKQNGYDILVFGDYAMGTVTQGPVMPNVVLREAGLFRTRSVRGMQYPDFHGSRAFAVVDHEVAHIYVSSPGEVERAVEVLGGLAGVEQILRGTDGSMPELTHDRCGELVLVAEPGFWFAYPWWGSRREAPEYAGHVDIHNKPGYDPCELFWGWPPPSVARDPSRIRGSHGRTGKDRETVFATTLELDREPTTLLELSGSLRQWAERIR